MQILEIIRSGSVVRDGFAGVRGLDVDQVLARLGAGISPLLVLDLVQAAEQGVLEGVEEARERAKSEKENAS